MILAHMAAQYPEELTCDMAETYHVLDWRALGLPLAATLAAGLRENSRTRMALAGAKVPTETCRSVRRQVLRMGPRMRLRGQGF